MQSSNRQTLTAYAFLAPALIIIGLFQFYPMISALLLSLWDYFPGSPNNHFVGLAHFQRLIYDSAFWSALLNSLLYLLVVPVVIGLSLLLAVLVEPSIPGIGFFRACYYVPVVTMMIVVAFTWRLILDTDVGVLNQLLRSVGLIDTGIPWITSEKMALWSVMSVTVWKGLGYYMVMFLVGLKAIPRDLLEAARIDGASPWQSFVSVKIPCLWPTISLVSILSAISAIQVFEEIYMMTNGRIGTATLVFQIYERGFRMGGGGGIDMGYACAMGVVLFVLLFAFTGVAVRAMDRAYSTN
jgi:putative chitobiose transport system permease protein